MRNKESFMGRDIEIKPNKKRYILSAIFAGIVFGITMYLFDLALGEVKNLVVYLLEGIFYGGFMGVLLFYFSKRVKKVNLDLEEDEQIEFKGNANLFRGIEGVVGRLFLTNKNVVFKSHKFNIQKGQTNIKLNDISEILKKKRRFLSIMGHGIKIKTKDGQNFHFITTNQDVWVEKLNEKINTK